MKTAICYFSILGSSKQYARWLAEEIGGDMLMFKEATDERLAGYDKVVVMSGTFGGWMPLTTFLTTHWETLKSKKVIAVAAGSVPAEHPESQKQYEAIPEEIRHVVSFYKLPCATGLKLWLTGPFSAYQMWRHAAESDWHFSRAALDLVIDEVQPELERWRRPTEAGAR